MSARIRAWRARLFDRGDRIRRLQAALAAEKAEVARLQAQLDALLQRHLYVAAAHRALTKAVEP